MLSQKQLDALHTQLVNETQQQLLNEHAGALQRLHETVLEHSPIMHGLTSRYCQVLQKLEGREVEDSGQLLHDLFLDFYTNATPPIHDAFIESIDPTLFEHQPEDAPTAFLHPNEKEIIYRYFSIGAEIEAYLEYEVTLQLAPHYRSSAKDAEYASLCEEIFPGHGAETMAALQAQVKAIMQQQNPTQLFYKAAEKLAADTVEWYGDNLGSSELINVKFLPSQEAAYRTFLHHVARDVYLSSIQTPARRRSTAVGGASLVPPAEETACREQLSAARAALEQRLGRHQVAYIEKEIRNSLLNDLDIGLPFMKSR